MLCDSLRSVDDGSYPPALSFLAADASSARFNDPTNAHGVTADAADRVFTALSQLSGDDRRRAIVFTIVRDPISRFSAGFAELNLFKSYKTANREDAASSHDDDPTRLRTFQTSNHYADHFVRRFVTGGLDLDRSLNAHVLPQVAFLSRLAPSLAAAAAVMVRSITLAPLSI